MGKEADCAVAWGRKRARGKALLETAELVFRSPELRLRIPLAEVHSAAAEGEWLNIRWGEDTVGFEIGAREAARWAEKIKNPRSRIDKLGVKPGHRVVVVGVGDAGFAAEVRARVGEGGRVGDRLSGENDAIFFGAAHARDLARLPAVTKFLKKNGALWIVRAKGKGNDASGVSEAAAMRAGKAAGLVDVKVVAFSPTHTAEKFVIPLARR
jgi:hypothetical protein